MSTTPRLHLTGLKVRYTLYEIGRYAEAQRHCTEIAPHGASNWCWCCCAAERLERLERLVGA